MFASQEYRLDFADTRSFAPDSVLSRPSCLSRFDGPDAIEQMALADAADSTLLRLVACAALATLVLALAASLGH